jgi:hypothetical protein
MIRVVDIKFWWGVRFETKLAVSPWMPFSIKNYNPNSQPLPGNFVSDLWGFSLKLPSGHHRKVGRQLGDGWAVVKN